MSSFFNWFVDSLASEDVIDLYFILSGLVLINLTEAERSETTCYDALASATTREHGFASGSNIPTGKKVWL